MLLIELTQLLSESSKTGTISCILLMQVVTAVVY